MDSNMLNKTVSLPKVPTHMLPEKELVKPILELTKSQDTLMFPNKMLTNQPPLLPNNQFQLPLMPLISNSTLVESSLTVKLNLITELPLLDTTLMLGLLKTHGVAHGEKKDILDLLEETPVVLLTLPLTLKPEQF